MGTVVDKLNYLKETKTAIKNALVEKGVEVADSDTFRSYAQKVADIPAGGGDIDALIDNSITEINSSVTSIRNYAFFGCKNLVSANFPNVTTVGEGVFSSCSSLKSASFSKATTIASRAFNGSRQLETVLCPNLKTINSYSFTECSNLKNIDFPEVTTIGFCGFYITGITSANFPNATTVEGEAFRNSSSLKSASFPKLKTLNDSTFRYCGNLEVVSFPLVETIGGYNFQDCYKLTIASFPKLKEIKSFAFYGCKLKVIYIGTESDTVCILSDTTISSSVTDIYVPEALVDSYKTATNWSSFADKIKAYTGETA